MKSDKIFLLNFKSEKKKIVKAYFTTKCDNETIYWFDTLKKGKYALNFENYVILYVVKMIINWVRILIKIPV